jgi:hypothetical protein
MKTKFTWILLTGLLFAACQLECPHCASTNYVENERIPALHMGDSIFFKSDINRVDSFLVSNVSRRYFYTDKKLTSDYYDLGYSKIKYACNSDSPNFCFGFALTIEWDRTIIDWPNFQVTIMTNTNSIDLQVNGLLYHNVRKVSADIANLKLNDIVTVYFSDQQGILSYRLKSGEYFERIKLN